MSAGVHAAETGTDDTVSFNFHQNNQIKISVALIFNVHMRENTPKNKQMLHVYDLHCKLYNCYTALLEEEDLLSKITLLLNLL